MKTNKFWSILLCLVMCTTTGAFLTSCDNDNEPSSTSTNNSNNNDNGSNSGSDSNNNNGENNSGSNSGSASNDDAAPAAPTGVTAKAGGPKQFPWVEVKWDYADNVDQWDVYRSTSESGSYSKIGSKQASKITHDYLDDKNLEYNTSYYYKVKAIKNGKESDFSASDGAYIEAYP